MCFHHIICILFKETNQEAVKGSVKFAVGAVSGVKSLAVADSTGDTDTTKSYYSALVTIVNQNGTEIFSSYHISFFKFGDQYISENLSLEVGSYKLTQFIIFKNGAAIYVTPLEGSERAQLVNNPLPVEFTVNVNSNTLLSPEVLAIGNNPPQAFGYASFNFSIIKTIFFKIIVFGDDSALYDTIPVSAHLEVSLNSDSAYSNVKVLNYPLISKINNIEVTESPNYHLRVYKEGYSIWYNHYSFVQLKYYATVPLKVYLHRLANDTIH
jgi:hypothetical protein